MVVDRYKWPDGVKLLEHTKRKHKILQEYFYRYLTVRCQRPQQSRFRLAIVDGFAGGGRYSCGSPGSPIIFIEELRSAARNFNLKRLHEGVSPLEIECLLVLNDEDPQTIELLKANAAPSLMEAKEDPSLNIMVEYNSLSFDALYKEVKPRLNGVYRNVVFNLDQYGHSQVQREIISDICASFFSAEIFLTFAIQSLLTFLQRDNPELVRARLGFLGGAADLTSLEGRMGKNDWLGAAERLVFECFRPCAAHFSPFSINNPDGWRYWLMHFANNYRARQEYNDILHRNSSTQAHFGRSGLNMLAYDPKDDAGALYLFDVSDRARAKEQLYDDIPRLVSEFGDVIGVGEFYSSIYNMTPAHSEEIHSAIIENPDMEVITENGGERRKPNTITAADTLRIKPQRSFFPFMQKDLKKF